MAVMRLAILAFAALACAWFGLAASEAHQINHVTKLVNQSAPLTAAQSRTALAELDSAGRLNPDREVDLLRATVLENENQTRAAERVLEQVVHDEPMNSGAWFALASVAGGDPSLERSALDHIAVLVPSLRRRVSLAGDHRSLRRRKGSSTT